MKKTIPALAAWAVCTCACAQSDVSIFGTIDTYVARAKSGNSSTMRIDSGGNTASRIGFRGKEDLGGGMSARFMLEAGIDSDTGAGNPTSSFAFTRQSFVGLAGPWGAIDMGRMYTPMFQAVTRADGFGLNTVFSPMNLAAAVDAQPGLRSFAPRANNMLRYRTPVGTGLYTDLAYAPGESASPSQKSGDLYSGSVGWALRPVYVAYAFQRARSGSAAAPEANPTKSTYQSLSAAYDGGVWKVFGTVARNGVNRTGVGNAHILSLGAAWNVTPQSRLVLEGVHRKVSGSDRTQLAWTLGYDYALSKRTALYGRWLHLSNRGNSSVSLAQIPVTPADSTGRCNTLTTAQAAGVLQMKQRPRIYYSDIQKALMWERWKQGWTLQEIGKQCVHRHRFESLQHASRLIGDRIRFYNHRRPHQALNM